MATAGRRAGNLSADLSNVVSSQSHSSSFSSSPSSSLCLSTHLTRTQAPLVGSGRGIPWLPNPPQRVGDDRDDRFAAKFATAERHRSMRSRGNRSTREESASCGLMWDCGTGHCPRL
jgi:hypothetical protein